MKARTKRALKWSYKAAVILTLPLWSIMVVFIVIVPLGLELTEKIFFIIISLPLSYLILFGYGFLRYQTTLWLPDWLQDWLL